MAYSCNYPIWHTFDASTGDQIEYNIYIGGTLIYTGIIFPHDISSGTIDIDISNICREYLDTFYEQISSNGVTSGLLPVNGLISSVITFRVESSDNINEDEEYSYTVVYDYNTDYVSQLDDIRNLNDPIDDRIDPRQIVFVSGYNLTGSAQEYTYQVNGGAVTPVNISGNRFQYLAVPLSSYVLQEGNKVVLSMSNVASHTYTVTRECPNRYALYYVNKFGGLDSLLMTGKYTESWNPDTTSVRLYSDRGNRRDWEQKKINIDIDHIWELNTGLLTNEGAAKIDHLIYSPKVLIHDLANDRITTVLIQDTNYSVKRRHYDIPQYTITVKESQKQLRR